MQDLERDPLRKTGRGEGNGREGVRCSLYSNRSLGGGTSQMTPWAAGSAS